MNPIEGAFGKRHSTTRIRGMKRHQNARGGLTAFGKAMWKASDHNPQVNVIDPAVLRRLMIRARAEIAAKIDAGMRKAAL